MQTKNTIKINLKKRNRTQKHVYNIKRHKTGQKQQKVIFYINTWTKIGKKKQI